MEEEANLSSQEWLGAEANVDTEQETSVGDGDGART